MKQTINVQELSFFDFYGAIYGDDIFWRDDASDVVHRRKTGMRDNWLYFYNSLDETIVKKCFENLCISLKRKKNYTYH